MSQHQYVVDGDVTQIMQWCHKVKPVMSLGGSFTKLKSIKLENIFEIWESYYKNKIIAGKLLWIMYNNILKLQASNIC